MISYSISYSRTFRTVIGLLAGIVLSLCIFQLGCSGSDSNTEGSNPIQQQAPAPATGASTTPMPANSTTHTPTRTHSGSDDPALDQEVAAALASSDFINLEALLHDSSQSLLTRTPVFQLTPPSSCPPTGVVTMQVVYQEGGATQTVPVNHRICNYLRSQPTLRPVALLFRGVENSSLNPRILVSVETSDGPATHFLYGAASGHVETPIRIRSFRCDSSSPSSIRFEYRDDLALGEFEARISNSLCEALQSVGERRTMVNRLYLIPASSEGQPRQAVGFNVLSNRLIMENITN